ncbi:MAG: MBL fold metallo-hydrolase [Gemmatimonadetes bacterium]|nr:MBL fold metallo-hydrolase [Gemmatimonadota bacterium]NIO30781.1 MBL fold metallo-hydrolase [Gemmatimonadota bacterium]
MRLVTVGTGTVVPDPERASACHWIEHGEARLLVDCGAGGLQGLARSGLVWGDVGHLIISHFHTDHIGEIPSLIFALRHALETPRRAPLEVWGPTGTRRLFAAWADALGSWLVEPGFEVAIHELQPGASVDVGGVQVRVAKTHHTDESIALRFEAGGWALGYTGDTGPSEELGEFFRGVDLLLAECSLPDELAVDIHLSPTSLARLATDAEVKRVAVTHVYPQLRRLDVPDLVRRAGYSGEVIMVADGSEIQI